MGFNDDEQRINELSQEMPKEIAKYFSKVAKVHKGNKLGLSWPISLKKFSKPIIQSLSNDSVMYSIQEGTGTNHGLTKSADNKLSLMINETKEAFKKLRSKDTSYIEKYRLTKALPASLFFLSGLEAYASEASDISKYNENEVLGALTTAGGLATTTNADDQDVGGFFTTFAIRKSIIKLRKEI